MIRRPRSFLGLCAAALLAAQMTHGAENRITPDMVVEALAGQGFSVESVTRTLLGRARIVASQGLVWREVVLDMSSGQVLRDYAVEFAPQMAPATGQKTMPRGGKLIAESDFNELEP